MKLCLTIKSPDSVSAFLSQANVEGLTVEASNIIDEYFEENEYALLEFDTETGTAIVVPNSEQE